MTAAFDAVVRTLQDGDQVELGRMFGSATLKRHGKVFAMAVKGDLVVKVAAPRAAELVAAGDASYFDPGARPPFQAMGGRAADLVLRLAGPRHRSLRPGGTGGR